MVFSSLQFVFLFLPAILVIIVLSRKHIYVQNLALVLASLLFYSFGDLNYTPLLISTILINWLIPRAFGTLKRKYAKIAGVTVILVDVGALFWFKYSRWVFGLLGSDVGSGELPIGISFFTFQAISYVADVMLMDKYKAEKNLLNVGLYISFFPQLIAGPIVRYDEMSEQIKNRMITMEGIEYGSFRFIWGFCKKILLADSMGIIVSKAFSTGTELSISFAWLGAVAYTFQIYMDFSGYSDMALGLGSIFGFRIPENFNNPYRASCIRDFWRRWHMTLSVWFRDYVYIPLGGNKNGRHRTVLNILIVWMLTGLWHGANYTFMIWGLLYGILVLLEKLLQIDKAIDNMDIIMKTLYRAFSLLLIIVLWVIFRADNIQVACDYLRCMFLNNNGLQYSIELTLLYIFEFKYALLCCLIICIIPIESLKERRVYLWPGLLVFFIVSIAYLIKGSYSPFLYFNF